MNKIAFALLLASSFTIANGQDGLFRFNQRGRFILTSPSIWSANGGSRHAYIVKQAGADFNNNPAPSANMYGLSMSGTYVTSGILIGYDVNAAVSLRKTFEPKAVSPTGPAAQYGSQNYAVDIMYNMGVLAFHYKGLSIYPLGGVGIAAFVDRLTADPDYKAAYAADLRETAYWTPAVSLDGSLNLQYTLPAKADGLSRFTIGLRGGYKTYHTIGTLYEGVSRADGNIPALNAGGPYARLALGVGIVRHRNVKKVTPVDNDN